MILAMRAVLLIVLLVVVALVTGACSDAGCTKQSPLPFVPPKCG